MFKALYKVPVVFLLISLSVIGQTEASKTGSITGRVVNESGQPLPNARVSVSPVEGGRSSGWTATNREGTFTVTGLDPVSYRINVDTPGYITPSDESESGPSTRQYKVGDTVRFVLIKGGVVTGTVTAANGEPVIGIGVRAWMIRNHKDQRIPSPMPWRGSGITDDRGVYRLYGLPSGTYKVLADTSADTFYTPFNAFDTFLPTYAPSSSTRDGAAEISVRAGEETSNIDISFRAEMGRTISGTVSGPGIEGGITVNLNSVVPANSHLNVSQFNQPGTSQFTFQGIADGDYYLTAETHSQSGEVTLSDPKLIRVKGADIEDLDLTVKTQGSISGRVLFEESKINECQGKKPPAFKEVSVSAWRKDREVMGSMSRPANPDLQGNFKIRNLASSQYYFFAWASAPSWYLKSIAIAPSTSARGGKPTDVTRVLTTVKAGDRLSGLIVTFAQGGASFEGQVVLGEGETVPERLLVYLVPSEREAADDLLRFYVGAVSKEGKIGPFHLPPGRYWILTQQVTDIAQAPFNKMRQPDGTETRVQLRRDAEAAKMEIELKPCQSVVDFRLPLK